MKKTLSIFLAIAMLLMTCIPAIATETTNDALILEAGAVIPEGGTYYVGVTSRVPGDYDDATAVYTSGDNMPETVTDGDAFVYGDYEYRFNRSRESGNSWSNLNQQNGWGVAATLILGKTEFGDIYTSINGKDVVCMSNAFNGFVGQLSIAPVIPTTVTNMEGAFKNCTALIEAPVIPNGVTNMADAFFNCKTLTETPAIPDSVTNMSRTFSNCTGITSASAIPENVTDVYYTFYNCTELTSVEVNAEPTSYIGFVRYSGVTEIIGSTSKKTELLNTTGIVPAGGFYYVGISTGNPTGDYSGYTNVYNEGDKMPESTAEGDRFVYGDYEYKIVKRSNNTMYWTVKAIDNTKTKYDEILSNINNAYVTSLSYTFANCTNMTEAPAIPETITDLGGTFYNCTALKAAPAIPNGATNMSRTFMNCINLKTGPEAIPTSVKNLAYTFYGCKNLNAVIVVPASVTDVSYMLYNSKNIFVVEVNGDPENYMGFILRSNVGEVTGLTSIKEELLATNDIYVVQSGGTYYTGVPSSNVTGNYENATGTYDADDGIPRIQRLDRYVYGDYEYVCMKSGNTKYWQVRVLDKTKAAYGEILSTINGAPVTSMNYTFSNCTNLVVAPEIPDTITSMMGTFLNCTSLTGVGDIPAGVTEMRRTFMGCEKLSVAPTAIPDGVVSLIYTFYNCKSLPESPAIPAGVDNLYLTFYNCKKLSQVEVNGNPTYYSKAFRNSGITSVSGTTSITAELLGTK